MGGIFGDFVQLAGGVFHEGEQRLTDIAVDLDLIAVSPRLHVHNRHPRIHSTKILEMENGIYGLVLTDT